MRKRHGWACVPCILLSLGFAAPAAGAKRNIVLFVADDHGRDAHFRFVGPVARVHFGMPRSALSYARQLELPLYPPRPENDN